MEYWLGLLCAASAAIAFGVQYAPVKKYEIYDGITFQWFMCAGIFMVGFLSSIIFGDFGMEEGCLLIILGGGLWVWLPVMLKVLNSRRPYPTIWSCHW